MAICGYLLVVILLLSSTNGQDGLDGLLDLTDEEGDGEFAELLPLIERYLSERENQATDTNHRRRELTERLPELTQFLSDSQSELQQNFIQQLEQNAVLVQEIDTSNNAGNGGPEISRFEGAAGGPGGDEVDGRFSILGPRRPRNPFRQVQKMLAARGQSQGFSLLARYQAYLLNQLKESFELTREDLDTLFATVKDLVAQLPPVDIFVPDVQPENFTIDTCPYPDASISGACDQASRYRTIDGSCNNLKLPLWGRSLRPLARYLQPDYADGIDEPRVGVNDSALPSARHVSVNLFEGSDIQAPAHTLTTMVFGQFADHDLGLTPIDTLSRNTSGVGDTVDVQCGDSECETEGPENEACFPILVDPSDPFFSRQSCLMFVRSQPAPAENCTLGPRQQMNNNTAYLDASMVYGSTLQQSLSLRDLTDSARGRMKVTDNAESTLKPLLPQTEDSPECIRHATETIKCFAAGDTRVNEQVSLTAMHTIFVRYHNYIEEHLHRHNPHWSGEKLFQETRRILIAVWQYILYNEFVPIVVGPEKVRQYKLGVSQPDQYTGYDDSVQVDVKNVFQTAAFRFGHTLIPTFLNLSSNKFGNEGSVFLSEAFEHPAEVYNNEGPADSGVDNLMFAQVSQPSFQTDHTFTPQITRHLFTDEPPHGVGTDLTALNIQRGRDHGLPGYVRWREWCGLSVPSSFDEMTDIPEAARTTLQSVYSHVEDVDIYPGGISERPVSGGLVGPTFACIIARQFRDLRVADRFWFENEGAATSFTAEQIAEIRRASLAKITCHTLDNVDTIQSRVLLQPYSKMLANIGYRIDELYHYSQLYAGNNFNERGDCSDLPDLDLSKWTE